MHQSNHKAFLYAFIVSIGGFIFGLDIMLISGTFEYTTIEFGLTAIQKGNIGAAPGYGALVALIVGGYFCEHWGRKKTLMIIAALYIVSAVGSALAPSYAWLFSARLIGGLAFTSLSLASMYIGEIAPPQIRGKLVGLNQLNIVIGILVAAILNYYFVAFANSGATWTQAINLTDANVWRWMLGIETLPAVIWFALLFLIPESPRWLVLNNKQEQARKVIHQLTSSREDDAQVDVEFNQIVDSLKDTGHSLSYVEQIKLLFSKNIRIALTIGMLMAAVQALSGMNAILTFLPMIFQQVGAGESAFAQAIWVNLIGAFFTVLALMYIDKIGRRIMLIGGLIVCTLSLAVVGYGFYEATYMITSESLTSLAPMIDTSVLTSLVGIEYTNDVAFKQAVLALTGADSFSIIENALLVSSTHMQGMLVLIGIIVFVCSFNFSLGPILWILFSEIFPTKVRAVAITSSALIATIFGGILVPTLFPWQLENFGAATTFLIYAGFCVSGLLFVAKMMPETKGRTIEEIEEMFGGRLAHKNEKQAAKLARAAG
ncbi:MFS transporter [Colwellia sp. MSW7]|uniref:MFS transporter n=1 Tax=Colwellia maritima TaxID=2912588 RepID=A0ABS9X139_9GAMM|nr:MFS transporter [Colwellia maritima]MCI2283906.1 MFS transporter [Colwellia maritima]